MVLSIFVDEQSRRIFVNIDPYHEGDEEFFLKDTEIRMFESLQTFIQGVNNNIIFDLSDDVPKIVFKQNLQHLNQPYLEKDYTYEDSELLFEQNVQNLNRLSIQNDNVDDNKKKESSLFEDDVYLRYRNDAFEMTSIAKRLSKDYKNVSRKGDYILANQLCHESKWAWQIVDNLHAMAAENIFRIKNQQNGLMKIDLHGLHPSEAIEATRKRLGMIETNQKRMTASSTCSNKKPIYLKVITGVGKHSRHGVAKIPTAVKTFLTDKGYEFFESMPGVIMVRLKFCAD